MCTALETRKDPILLLPSFLLAQTAYIENIHNVQNKYDPAAEHCESLQFGAFTMTAPLETQQRLYRNVAIFHIAEKSCKAS